MLLKTTNFLRKNKNKTFVSLRKKSKLQSLFQKAKRQCMVFSIALGLAFTMPMTTFATSGGTGGGGQDIWSWLQTALSDVYNKFLSVSTIAACVAASVCLILMNFSTDDRAVSTSRAWLKRILVSWVVLNVLGFIMTYLVNLTSGGRYIPSVG